MPRGISPTFYYVDERKDRFPSRLMMFINTHTLLLEPNDHERRQFRSLRFWRHHVRAIVQTRDDVVTVTEPSVL